MISYFISDLHLSLDTPKLAHAFSLFVEETAKDADKLYILGDFFDSWIGDDDDNPFFVGIQNQLAQYTQNGLPIAFVHGNRDFLIGQTFAEKTGVQLLPEKSELKLAGKNILLMHGDSLCTSDTEYMAFRAQSRSPQWQEHVLALPLEQRRALAAQMRAQSKSMNSNKPEDIMDVNPSDVAQCFKDHDIQLLLHGHTHRPATHEYDFGKRIVLGDWTDTGWYLRADDQNIALIEFSI